MHSLVTERTRSLYAISMDPTWRYRFIDYKIFHINNLLMKLYFLCLLSRAGDFSDRFRGELIGIWTLKLSFKYRITSAGIKFMTRTAKYTWKDYKTNKDTLSYLKINMVFKENSKLQTQIDKTYSPNGQRLLHSIMKYQPRGNEPKNEPSKDF